MFLYRKTQYQDSEREKVVKRKAEEKLEVT